MTITWDKLEKFVNQLKRQYTNEIPDGVLNTAIAKSFGLSDYTQRTLKKNLVDHGFLKMHPEYFGIWVFPSSEIKKTIEEDEEEINKRVGDKDD